MTNPIQLVASLGRIWQGDHMPELNETTIVGTISISDLYLNTITNIYYLCTAIDPDNPNMNLQWQRFGILTPSEMTQLSLEG